MNFYKVPLNADLSKTSYRVRVDKNDFIYIEYNEGFVGEDWIEITEEEFRKIAPEEIETTEPTQLDRIEQAIKTSDEEKINAAIDEYTLDLIESGVI